MKTCPFMYVNLSDVTKPVTYLGGAISPPVREAAKEFQFNRADDASPPEQQRAAMTTLRPFTCDDLFKFNNM